MMKPAVGEEYSVEVQNRVVFWFGQRTGTERKGNKKWRESEAMESFPFLQSLRLCLQCRTHRPAMNIPEEFLISFEHLADTKKIPDAVFKQLVTLTFEILVRAKTEQHLAGTVFLSL